MSQYGQYTSVSPAEVGLMTGMIGAGIGYTLAPRKYNLEQLLTQKPDVFEKSIPKKFLSKATDSQKKAHKLLVEARKSILEASKTNTGEAKLAELIRAPKFENAYKAIKSFLPKARVQTAIVLGVVGGFIGALSKIIFFGDKNS
jgi:hypothetical protein